MNKLRTRSVRFIGALLNASSSKMRATSFSTGISMACKHVASQEKLRRTNELGMVHRTWSDLHRHAELYINVFSVVITGVCIMLRVICLLNYSDFVQYNLAIRAIFLIPCDPTVRKPR